MQATTKGESGNVAAVRVAELEAWQSSRKCYSSCLADGKVDGKGVGADRAAALHGV